MSMGLPVLLLVACIPLGVAHGQPALTSRDSLPTSRVAGSAAYSDLVSYNTTRHDARVASAQLGHMAPPKVLEQLTAWLQEPLSKTERLRVLADSVVFARQAGRSQDALFFSR